MRKLEQIWEENKTGIFEKSDFMLHNLHVLPSFLFTLIRLSNWREPLLCSQYQIEESILGPA